MAMFDKHKSAKQSTPETREPRVSQPAPASSNKPGVSPSSVAMIGHGIQISGDVKADSNLKIEGRIEGRSIQCTHDVEVGGSGQVNASIMAKVVKISGSVKGDIGGSEKVLITASGRVQGNIIAPRVQLEDGALFRGSIDMNPTEKTLAEKKPAEAKQAAPKAPQAGKATASSPSSAARTEPSLNLKSG